MLIWLSNLMTMNVPDQGYSRNMSCALSFISTFLLVPTMHLIMYVHSQKSEKSNTLKVFEGKGYPKVFEGKVTQKSLRARLPKSLWGQRLPKSLWGQGYPKIFEGKVTQKSLRARLPKSLWGQRLPKSLRARLPMSKPDMVTYDSINYVYAVYPAG